MKQHYIIPIFIPEKACPFRCVYCNQYLIANTVQMPTDSMILATIESYLQTIPRAATKRVAFFGGSFTGMTLAEQEHYLTLVQPYIAAKKINNIQLSTRPDYINEAVLTLLKRYHVTIIELGAQSLHDSVLSLSGRGHTVAQVHQAAKLIKNYGFQLGLQMMIGLPNDTLEKAKNTAQQIIELGADFTRIYPTLVIQDTDLATLYQQGKYTPLSMEEAVHWSEALLTLFELHRVQVLRLGLHPSEGLISGETLLAGPFHVSFKELVLSYRWRKVWKAVKLPQGTNSITLKVSPSQLNAAIGYQGSNRNWWQQQGVKVFFRSEVTLNAMEWTLEVEPNLLAKVKL